MTEMSKPDLAGDLRRVHMTVTRGLDVSIGNADQFAQEGFPDEETTDGFRAYVGALLSFVSAHHAAEDAVVFPYFEERLPEMPFDRLQEEHQRIEEMLERAQEHLDETESEPQPALRGLEGELRQIQGLWHPHIAIEEEHMEGERLAEVMPVAEQGRVSGAMAEHFLEHAGPDYLIIPFGLYNLPADERAILSRNMPPEVLDELVPVVWKERWAPMKPFLLE